MILIFSPVISLMAVILLSHFYSILLAVSVSLLVFVPLFIFGLRHKQSIFHNKHNTQMLKQIIDNSPKGVKAIALKLKLTK